MKGDLIMTKTELRKKQIKEQEKLLREKLELRVSDADIWNLKWLITQIQPGSRNWNIGCIRSLRKAIKALEKENEKNTQK